MHFKSTFAFQNPHYIFGLSDVCLKEHPCLRWRTWRTKTMEKTEGKKPEDAERQEPNIFVIQLFYKSRQKDTLFIYTSVDETQKKKNSPAQKRGKNISGKKGRRKEEFIISSQVKSFRRRRGRQKLRHSARSSVFSFLSS